MRSGDQLPAPSAPQEPGRTRSPGKGPSTVPSGAGAVRTLFVNLLIFRNRLRGQ